jgi:hypothetical protein
MTKTTRPDMDGTLMSRQAIRGGVLLFYRVYRVYRG